MKILHLIDSLDAGDSTRQLQLLGPALAQQVCCLGSDTACSAALRQAGIVVHALGWTRWFDPSVLWSLRRLLRETAPDVIHAWQMPALRALAVVAPGLLPRVVMNAPAGQLAWWDRRLLECVRCVAPIGCVAEQEPEKRCQDPFQAEKGPDTFIRIACVARLEREAGFREAIWAFDFLQLLFPDAQLQIVGTGGQCEALQALTHGLRSAGRVRFLGALPDATTVLGGAHIVWVPSLANRGQQVALEAMALGKPVVGSDVPCLREVIRDGETGFLIPPGDVVALARRTYALMQDELLRQRIGTAARLDVQCRFPIGAAVELWREVYRSIAA